MKKIKLLFFVTVFSLVAVSASVIAYTYAAYLNTQKYELPIDLNSKTISSHFTNGGAGTSTSPYLISNATDLRTLQKLNVLGVFSKTTYFQVSASFAWSGNALAPIGNEDYPFYSQFDGNGYSISGLLVNGAQTNDVGMFGYVAMGGTVKNLILTTPTINVVASTGSTTYSPSANPMYTILNTAATNLPNLTFSNSTPASFTVPTNTVTGTDSALYTIVYQSSDTDYLYSNTSGVWTCRITDSNGTSLHPVQLTARVFAYYNNMIISYTLERWQINVNDDGTVNAPTSTTSGYFKTIHRTTPTAFSHETYVGIFVGHLDGTAAFLGLDGGNASGSTNGRITVNGRNARSYSCLIGRSHEDDTLDESAVAYDQKYLDFNTIIPAKGINNTSYATPTLPLTDFNTQQSRAITATKAYGISAADTDYFRFYPSLSNNSISYTNPDNTTTTLYVQRTTASLRTAVYSKKGGWLGFYGRQNYSVINGMWIWLNAPTNEQSSGVYTSNSFEVKIKMTYVATSTSTSNYFQVLTNAYSSSATSSLFLPAYNVSSYHWSVLGTSVYDPTAHPVVTTVNGVSTSGQLVTTTIVFTVDRTSSFWEGFLSDSTYYPMLAVGVGKGTDPTQSENTSNSTNHYYYDDYSSDAFTLNMVKLQVVFTSKDGNVSQQISNVDYLYKLPTRSTDFSGGTYTAWNNASNVKIQFNISNYSNNNNGTTYAFYRNYTVNLVNTTVNCLYTTNTSFAPTNTTDYEAATLTKANL